MGAIQMSIGYEYPTIELQCAFVDFYMAKCPPVYALIYIYSLRKCLGGVSAVSSREIADVFNILETDVHNALGHWQEKGLINLNKNGECVTFLPLPDSAELTKAGETGQAGSPVRRNAGEVMKFAPAGRPQYTVEELAEYKKQNAVISELFSFAAQTLGKYLTYYEMNLIFGFYDWLRLPVDVIGYLLSYCAANDHLNMRYIEKVAIDWSERQIDDMEKAIEYVRTFGSEYKEILRAMGQTSGYPSPTQRKFIEKWLSSLGFTTELVLHACDKAATQIGKPKFSYVDKILEGWSDKGIKTKSEADADAADYAKDRQKQQQQMQPSARQAKNSRYANFKQRERDYDQLEKMERAYLNDRLGQS
ncbi:MAG: DnaD domain protein [Defluviitaleaceae bacterium]|nr:DnaD domain protein [Defluviitaleaceae bacterium]